MVRGNTKKHHWSRENFQAKSKKGYNTSKKTEKKWEHNIRTQKIYIKIQYNRKNKTHKGTHNR